MRTSRNRSAVLVDEAEANLGRVRAHVAPATFVVAAVVAVCPGKKDQLKFDSFSKGSFRKYV